MVKGGAKQPVSGKLRAITVIFRAWIHARRQSADNEAGRGKGNKKPRQKPGQVVGSLMNDQPVTVMFTAFGPLPRRSGSVS